MPREVPWTSAITDVGKNALRTHGVDQADMIQNFRYEEVVFLLLFGRKASEVEADLLRAVIVSHVSHGITGQSTMAVRMAADCRSPFLNSALGGFLVGSGDFHQGALEMAMGVIREAGDSGDVGKYVAARLDGRGTFFGYGHRYHSRDPRAAALMGLCDGHGFAGRYVRAARDIEGILGPTRGRYMNIEAAGGAILLDLGVPSEVASLVIVVGRCPMLAAAYLERLRSGSKPFQRLAVYDVVPGRAD